VVSSQLWTWPPPTANVPLGQKRWCGRRLLRIRDRREQSKRRGLNNVRFQEPHQALGTAGMGALRT
jgi:hypothetical protein